MSHITTTTTVFSNHHPVPVPLWQKFFWCALMWFSAASYWWLVFHFGGASTYSFVWFFKWIGMPLLFILSLAAEYKWLEALGKMKD